MEWGRPDPQVIVQVRRRFAGRGQVTRARNLAVAPGAGFLQFADSAVANEFADAVEILDRVALGADLRGELVLVLEIGGLFHGKDYHLKEVKALILSSNHSAPGSNLVYNIIDFRSIFKI